MPERFLETEAVPRCPACGGVRRTALFEGLSDDLFGAPGIWALWRCEICHVAFLDPRPTRASITEAYRRYYTHGDGPPLWGGRAQSTPGGYFAGSKLRLRNGYLHGALGYPLRPAWSTARIVVPLLFPAHRLAFDTRVRHLRLPGSGARLLDVGCGSGEFLAEARALGWTVQGLEVDPCAANHAAARGLDVIREPIERAGLRESSYDAITMNHVIEHLHEPESALRVALRLLRPGGVLWVATPNIESPLSHLLGARWRGLEPPRHLLLFNRDALDAMLRRVGFAAVAWRRAYPLTRWIHAASGGGLSRTRLRLLELGSLVSDRFAEQIVATAVKPREGAA